MVVLSAMCMMLAAATAALSGCPALGIGGNPTLGEIVVHNDFSEGRNPTIESLSVVRVADECSDQELRGINLLPAPLAIGQSFTVKDLPEGRYYCIADYDYDCTFTDYDANGKPYTNYGRCDSRERGYVTVAAGGSVDWYVH